LPWASTHLYIVAWAGSALASNANMTKNRIILSQLTP
jgi:hypothetical protein